MVLYRLQGDRPAAHVVTTFAIRPHLAAMDVGVAGGAPCSGVGEDHLGMAPSTRHTLVRADQGVACLVVIEFRNGAYGFPTGRGMTVLTGDLQGTMGAARGGIVLRLCQATTVQQHQQTQNYARAKYPSP